jgi:hypothetical protein
MNKRFLTMAIIGLLLSISSDLRAAPAHTDRLLEERTTEEVAEEGLSLRRLKLRVEIHQTNDGGASVSIVDAKNGRTVGTRFLRKISKNRDAAIAELTIVVSALIREARPAVGAMGGLAMGGLVGGIVADWLVAMEPQALLSRHRPKSIQVIAVPSGKATKEAKLAADELARAYRAGGVAKVRGPSVATSTDSAAIMKHFGDGTAADFALVSVRNVGSSKRAIVTIYDKKGQVVTALSFTKGVAPTSDEQEGVAMPSDALGQISAIKKDRKEALRQYRRERIAMGTGIVAGNGYVGTYRTAHKGMSSKPLVGGAFYRAVGRPDYAKEYDEVYNNRWKGGLIAGVGTLGFIGFGTWAMTAGIMSAASDSDADWVTPSLLTGVSVGAIIGGIWYARSQGDPHPVDENTRIELAEDYNDGVRKRLGLSTDDTGSMEDTEESNIQLSPFLSGSGAGLGVGGTF